MSTPAPFYRGLSPAFLDALSDLADRPEGAWWRDVLARPDLVLAVRREYLNVYYRGAALFLVRPRGPRIVATVPAKYLARRQQPAAVTLGADGRFDLDPADALWPAYVPGRTLDEMVKAAAGLAGPEKIGLHALLLASPTVIDVEIAFGADPSVDSIGTEGNADAGPEPEREDGANAAAEALAAADGTDAADGPAEQAPADTGEAPASSAAPAQMPEARRQDRLDVATLERHAGGVRVAFHEAKHFTNPELRAAPDRTPPVAEQIARYRQTLTRQAAAIGKSYRDVCRALVRIDTLRRRLHGAAVCPSLDPLVTEVGGRGLVPAVDPEPRLVVFGFDQDQRDGLVWTRHRSRLTAAAPDGCGLRLYAVGSTAGRRSAAFVK